MADESEESDDWRFSVDEVGPDDPEVQTVGEDDDGPTVGVATEDGEGGNVAGSLSPDDAVEPGTPDLENVVFATAGAILTALVFAAVAVDLDPFTVAGIAGAIAAGSGLLYALFLRF